MKNQMTVDFTDSAALKDLITGWSIGETYEPKIKMQLNSVDGNQATFTVEQWTVEEGGSEGEDKVIETDMEHPVAVVMGMGNGKESSAASSY